MSAWRVSDNAVCVPVAAGEPAAVRARSAGCQFYGGTCTLEGGGAGQVRFCRNSSLVDDVIGPPILGEAQEIPLEQEPVYVGRMDPITITPRQPRPSPGASPMPVAVSPDKPAGSTGVYTYGQEQSVASAAWSGMTDAFGGFFGGKEEGPAAQQPQTGPAAQPQGSRPAPGSPEVQTASIFPEGSGWFVVGGVALLAVGAGVWALWPRKDEA